MGIHLITSLLFLSNILSTHGMVSTSPLNNILKELSVMNRNIEHLQGSLTETMTGMVTQLNSISKQLEAKFLNRGMRTRVQSAKNVVYSRDEVEDEDEEELRDVESDMLTLFRKMTRVRQRKFPVEKIQSEIEAVRSWISNISWSFFTFYLLVFSP